MIGELRWQTRRLYRRVGWVLPVATAVALAGVAVTLTERGGVTMRRGGLMVKLVLDQPAVLPRSVSAYLIAYHRHESTRAVIRRVFGAHGDEAVRVAYCESRLLTTARNGAHYGLFQMGAWERRTYGDADDAEGQARAAHRYFLAAGGWSPWECKP